MTAASAHAEPPTRERCGPALALAGGALVLIVTLFPYRFGPGAWSVSRVSLSLLAHPADLLANILLFVPLGFGLGRGVRRPVVLAAGLAVGVGLSLLVETLQVRLPSRDPALADLLANTAGLLVGLAWGRGRGGRALCRRVAGALRGRAAPLLTLLLAVDLALVAAGVAAARSRCGLQGWEPDFPLLCGNEVGGGRAWTGRLADLRFWARALPPERTGADLPSPDFAYPLAGPDDRRAAAGDLPDLVRVGTTPPPPPGPGVAVGPEGWLVLHDGADAVNRRLAAAGAFTVRLVATAADTTASGPARLVSLSGGLMRRNLTLGQDGADLVVRLRTGFSGENGTDPALVVPGVFAPGETRELAVSYDGATLRASAGPDGPSGRLPVRHAAFLCRGPLRYDPADRFGYDVAWFGLVGGLPGGLAAGAAAAWARRRRRRTD